jgi:hypothetical protein
LAIQDGAIVGSKNASGLGTTSTIMVGNLGLLSANGNFTRPISISAGGLLGWDGNGGSFQSAVTLNGSATVRMQN